MITLEKTNEIDVLLTLFLVYECSWRTGIQFHKVFSLPLGIRHITSWLYNNSNNSSEIIWFLTPHDKYTYYDHMISDSSIFSDVNEKTQQAVAFKIGVLWLVIIGSVVFHNYPKREYKYIYVCACVYFAGVPPSLEQ